MKALLASLVAAVFALAATAGYAAPLTSPAPGMSGDLHSSAPSDEDKEKDKDKDEAKKPE